MLSAIRQASEGMQAGLEKLEITAHNLANINTIGYKKDMVVINTFSEQLSSRMDGKNAIKVDVSTSHKQGALKYTRSDYDLAINGEGFFGIRNENGDIVYTRNGSFTKDQEGYLINISGDRVLNTTDDPIQIPDGKAEIDETGNIRVNGTSVAELKIVNFPKPYKLQKIGNSYFMPLEEVEPIEAENYRVSQGYVELSNVSSVEAMVEMINIINAVRDAESDKQVITMQDQTLDKAINQLGGR